MGTVNISGTDYDIYGTQAGAKTYFAAATHAAAWQALSGTDEKRYLVTATRMLDRAKWRGQITDPDTPQLLEWPRSGLVDKNGLPVDPNTVPVEVEEATYELANYMAGEDATAAGIQNSPNTGSNVRRTKQRDKVGDLETESETEYFRPTSGPGQSTRFPQIVTELIGLWLEAGFNIAGIVTGNTGLSIYDGRDLDFSDPGLP